MRVPGVIATEVGYSQGSVEDPSYEDVCSGQTGHVEVVQVTYNSQEVCVCGWVLSSWVAQGLQQTTQCRNKHISTVSVCVCGLVWLVDGLCRLGAAAVGGFALKLVCVAAVLAGLVLSQQPCCTLAAEGLPGPLLLTNSVVSPTPGLAPDALQVTFRQLLDEFFKRHDPTALNRQGNDVGTQYRGVCVPKT